MQNQKELFAEYIHKLSYSPCRGDGYKKYHRVIHSREWNASNVLKWQLLKHRENQIKIPQSPREINIGNSLYKCLNEWVRETQKEGQNPDP